MNTLSKNSNENRFIQSILRKSIFNYTNPDNFKTYKFKKNYDLILNKYRYTPRRDYDLLQAFEDFNKELSANNEKNIGKYIFRKLIKFWEGKNGDRYGITSKFNDCNKQIEEYDNLSRDELKTLLKKHNFSNKNDILSDSILSMWFAWILGRDGRLPKIKKK